jgi:hypothetical protein
LRNIYQQRKLHKLIMWQLFNHSLDLYLEHPEFMRNPIGSLTVVDEIDGTQIVVPG